MFSLLCASKAVQSNSAKIFDKIIFYILERSNMDRLLVSHSNRAVDCMEK